MLLVFAAGLVLIVEGLAYALFPDAVRRLMTLALAVPAERMRWFGAGGLALGVACVALARSVVGAP